ncbi:hypothetical protein [Lacrimispora amygdalina]|uniref:hypothetical protein n=1 Tax=Lacrimispora amygdalina TaxID=253257 RepID=UPI00196A86AC|nr:hypothetical protein [Clostridium indicum]
MARRARRSIRRRCASTAARRRARSKSPTLEATSAVGFGTQGQTDAAVARLKREAAALGANGVVLVGVGGSGSPVGMSVGAGTFGRHSGGGLSVGIPTTQKKAAGVAIWVPEAAVPPATTP